MKYGLKRPCAHCPFRTDIPGYLRPERCTEIAESLANGAVFPCHETTVDADDEGFERTATPDSQFCAGALLVMERMEQPNQVMRVAERTGVYDPSKLDHSSPVVRSLYEFRTHHAESMGEEEPECCHVVNADCEAPAGMLVGGMVVPAEATGEVHDCPGCGEPVCSSCSNGEGVCAYCAE